MRRTLLKYLTTTPFLLAACKPAAGAPRLPPDPSAAALASPEATARKARSEAVLRAEGVPVNATLPILPIEREVTPRGAAEVAGRTLALLTVAVKSEGLEQPVVDRLVRDYGLAPDLSPEERAFIANPAPTAADRAKFNWRYEGAWALLWALSYVPSLGKPTQQCDAATAVRAMRDHHQRAGFIADARLRPMSEILDQADRIYRYDWAAVDARANGRPAPAGLDEEITVERHKAFNWLIGYEGAAWDDVTTDT